MSIAALVAGSAWAQAPAQDNDSFVQGEKTLEARLLAPCCWTQTLDIHESEVAHSLRLEIRRRLQAGESPAAIETELVARYGERVRAVPKGRSLTGMGVWLSILVALSGLGVGANVVRWARRGRRGDASQRRGGDALDGKARDELDKRLDAELDELAD
jgi:cytochrome c-type biogenesis protein CcmH